MSDEQDDGANWPLRIGLGIAAVHFLDVQIPDWWLIVGAGAGAAVAAAYVYSGKIYDLFDDPRPVRIVQINANSEPLRAWKMSRDKFEEMQVEWGPLHPHTDGEFETYEAYAYSPDRNVAVGTWRRYSAPGSELVGQHDVADIEQSIRDLRSRLEPEARRGRELRVRLPAIARTIDYERSQAMNAALDPASPQEVTERTVDQIIEDELPEWLQPASVRNEDLSGLLEPDDEQDGDDWGDGLDLVVEDDGEALEPVGPIENGGTT